MKKPQAMIGLLAALGTVIGMLVAVVGLPYGRANFTAFADIYHGSPTALVTPFHTTVDCNPSTAAVDAVCDVPVSNVAQLSAAVSFGNESGSASSIGSFNFNLNTPDTTKMDAPLINNPGDFDDNPNANDTEFVPAVVIADYACSPPAPTNDDLSMGAGTNSSRLVCFSGGGLGPAQPDGTHYVLGAVTYDDNVVAVTTNTLTLSKVQVNDNGINELGSCNPTITTAMDCVPTTYNFFIPTATFTPTATETPQDTATFTPTNTATATNTSTPTNTATATPQGAAMYKVPENCAPVHPTNCDNSNPEQPHANLFLCENGPCSGEGEGNLIVFEYVTNVQTGDQNFDTVQDGLGAYEFDVEYDNFVIASLNPCDIVFGPPSPDPNNPGGSDGILDGAGAGRGPVDELNSSQNPYCIPDPNVANDGTCAMSIVLENIIHFGCVTSGQTPAGPTGNFDLAALNLIPHEDLVEDLFPGNDNGVVTKIKDNGCELVDIFGHPVLGSVGGGLIPVCGNVAITIRILEGDLDLDCDVDVSDEQIIGFRYGAFFGSLLYSKWFDLEPALHDLDIDIKDLQKVFGRDGSTCQNPIPAQTPVPFF